MASKKPLCKYGDKCYRKNPDHLKNYDHGPIEEESLLNDENSLPNCDEPLKEEKIDSISKNSELTKANDHLGQSESENLEKFDLSGIKG